MYVYECDSTKKCTCTYLDKYADGPLEIEWLFGPYQI